MSKERKTTEENLLMFKLPNEWGFFTNLQHPVIAEEYSNFRKELKKLYCEPLDDPERHEFDCRMMNKYLKEFKEWKKANEITGTKIIAIFKNVEIWNSSKARQCLCS